MPIDPTINFGKERVFVDRELCIQAFRENIQNSGTRKYNILFYHGIAGIGKSKLQEELKKILDEEYPYIFWVSTDFDVSTFRDISTFLITLRNKIQEKCDAEFHLFNAVHAIYWKKAHPEIPHQKQNYPLIEKGGFLEKIINVLESSGQIILAWEILNRATEDGFIYTTLTFPKLNYLSRIGSKNYCQLFLPLIFLNTYMKIRTYTFLLTLTKLSGKV